MDEEEIKKLRASFTNPYREDLPKTHKNQFGHTILGDEREIDLSLVSAKIDENGVISAEPNIHIADSPKMQKWAENQSFFEDLEPEPKETEEMSVHPAIKLNNVNIADLISELDEMDGTTERKQPTNNVMRACLNKDCLYALPKDAKFCLKCGTPQLQKFCTECGFKFPGLEKFCPDCGTKR